MNAAEVVVEKVESDGVLVVLHLLGKGVRETGKPAHAHPHVQIIALTDAGGNTGGLGTARNAHLPRALVDGAAISHFGARFHVAVDFHDLGVVDFRSKGFLGRNDIRAEAIRRKLDAVGNATGEIVHKELCRRQIAVPDVPAGDELRFGIDGRPDPDITPTFPLGLLRNIPFLTPDKTPNLITFNPFTGKIAEGFVLAFGASRPEVSQKFHNGRAVDTGNS